MNDKTSKQSGTFRFSEVVDFDVWQLMDLMDYLFCGVGNWSNDKGDGVLLKKGSQLIRSQ